LNSQIILFSSYFILLYNPVEKTRVHIKKGIGKLQYLFTRLFYLIFVSTDYISYGSSSEG
ncbi:TPA: hypothetical protein ACOZJO_001256, partial [Streptococcus pneumoniae]